MYPKPPKAFFPKEGDITTLRLCSYCGHALAQYRGIVEKKPASLLPETAPISSLEEQSSFVPDTSSQKLVSTDDDKDATDTPIEVWDEWFFCNEEHQQDFHAGKVYKR